MGWQSVQNIETHVKEYSAMVEEDVWSGVIKLEKNSNVEETTWRKHKMGKSEKNGEFEETKKQMKPFWEWPPLIYNLMWSSVICWE